MVGGWEGEGGQGEKGRNGGDVKIENSERELEIMLLRCIGRT